VSTYPSYPGKSDVVSRAKAANERMTKIETELLDVKRQLRLLIDALAKKPWRKP